VTDTSAVEEIEEVSGGLGPVDFFDPYQKIKLNANLCMRNLFKNNSKVLFNYWFIMFPQFMMRPTPEFTAMIDELDSFDVATEDVNFRKLIDTFGKRMFHSIENDGPSLFYLIRHEKT